MISRITAKKALEEFLSMPINSSCPVLEKFAALEGAVSVIEEGKENFVYVPGKRSDRAVLAAHADTVWDEAYVESGFKSRPREKNGVYSNGALRVRCGIGADDRAGCAMLWLLRESGHSLLILDGEEHGQRGAWELRRFHTELFAEINAHSYIVQLDRRGSSDYKFYNIPVTEEFRAFVESSTGYSDAGKNARTDIVVLCDTVCGVNFSVGYYDEHTEKEKLVFDEWYGTLCKVENMITPPQKRFPLPE